MQITLFNVGGERRPWFILVTLVLTSLILVSASEDEHEERVIGYGMTNLGRTVLTSILVGTLGLAAAGILANNGNAPFSARNGNSGKNSAGFSGLTPRQKFNCRHNPSLSYCGPQNGQRLAFKRPFVKNVPY